MRRRREGGKERGREGGRKEEKGREGEREGEGRGIQNRREDILPVFNCNYI